MDAYGTEVERVMNRLFDSLAEKDRRRYAAVEATKLGQTIRQGQAELEGTDDLDTGRVRKKGVDGNGGSSSSRP